MNSDDAKTPLSSIKQLIKSTLFLLTIRVIFMPSTNVLDGS